MVIALACFVGVLALFASAYWLFVLRPESAAHRHLARRLSATAGATSGASDAAESLVKEAAPRSSMPALVWLLARCSHVVAPLERLLDRAGGRISVGQLVLGCAFVAALGAAAALQLAGPPWTVLTAATVAGSLPVALVRWLAARRLARFEAQFAEAVDLIARALRAGHALTTGLALVAEEMPDPVRAEFARLHQQQRYGLPLSDALRQFAERVPSQASRFFVTALLTQREAGGDLAEVLDTLAGLVRDRFRLKRQVSVMSAHGRITATVLCGLPVVLTALLSVVAPDHIGTLFTDPLGIRMAVGALVLQVTGVFIMRRIVNFKI